LKSEELAVKVKYQRLKFSSVERIHA